MKMTTKMKTNEGSSYCKEMKSSVLSYHMHVDTQIRKIFNLKEYPALKFDCFSETPCPAMT